MTPLHPAEIPPAVMDSIRNALIEDIGHGDMTTMLTIDTSSRSEAVLTAKEATVVAGLLFFEAVFYIVDPGVEIKALAVDGQLINKGGQIASLRGSTRSILTAERVALNIMQRLCGVATLTRQFVSAVSGLPVKVVDTRKTTPNMRYMEKYAVRAGGGDNHRFGLYDGVLIKDNHIAACGGIKNAVEKVKKTPLLTKIEVEVKDLSELNEALSTNVDVIMLDNMDTATMKQAVGIARAARTDVLLEASGNVTLQNIMEIAETGIDIISTGYITHSARAADISLKIIYTNLTEHLPS
ncbi:carboxylating nicotinate-nucleotide diphosphorylase [Candidatus Magnetominusculus xianensis]|uniref:nicotinate-nucleotide diphosphorylase (carboxylating) n=1 Tax=Candidatus Magnetominusculus xianensis TaxID=1748249 RepID=A0ABR5SIJ0_9BACT|nr:carboxylating nicotinate-nucleotide diphosphorylase [Candidatus Magnetominusculus xianensis]KWT92710.1 putative nicotinate-nucleotide pyrophosphorylase [Candidatus Magnetominusculus xianensis]MBF0403739.1 carboxylating nicotinate-nucleotide diphosphorylase [Nitrospirota bacterium]